MKKELSGRDCEKLEWLVSEGLGMDGSHHKQWFLGEIGKVLGLEFDSNYEKGVAPEWLDEYRYYCS